MLARKMRAAFVNSAPGYWRPLREKLVEGLVPVLVLGTTGADEEPMSGASEFEAVESNVLNIQTISNTPRKWSQESTNNVSFQVNVIKTKRLNY